MVIKAALHDTGGVELQNAAAIAVKIGVGRDRFGELQRLGAEVGQIVAGDGCLQICHNTGVEEGLFLRIAQVSACPVGRFCIRSAIRFGGCLLRIAGGQQDQLQCLSPGDRVFGAEISVIMPLYNAGLNQRGDVAGVPFFRGNVGEGSILPRRGLGGRGCFSGCRRFGGSRSLRGCRSFGGSGSFHRGGELHGRAAPDRLYIQVFGNNVRRLQYPSVAGLPAGEVPAAAAGGGQAAVNLSAAIHGHVTELVFAAVGIQNQPVPAIGGEGIVIVQEHLGFHDAAAQRYGMDSSAHVAPCGKGRCDLLIGVVLNAVDEVVRQAVSGLQPGGAEGVAHAAHGVKLSLGDADVVLFQELTVDVIGELLHVAAQQRFGLGLCDAVGIVRGIDQAAVADIPAGAVIDGGGGKALALFDVGDQRIGKGHFCIGCADCGAESKQQHGGQ